MRYLLAGVIALGIALIIWLNFLSPAKIQSGAQDAVTEPAEIAQPESNPIRSAQNQSNSTASVPSDAEQVSQPVASTVSLSDAQQQQRQALEESLATLANCKETDTCPRDDEDPRAASYELAMQLKQQIDAYRKLHQQADYFDEQSARVAQTYLQYPDGHVQSAALALMRAQPANVDSATVLIDALSSGYDGKLMTEAMLELQRYPGLESEIQTLFAEQLREGAFNVSRAIAENIRPYLNQDNLAFYKKLADQLPAKSAKARYLKSAILEAEYQLSGG